MFILTFTEPVLPVLGGRLPKSLTESLAGGQFTTTRCNWVIQSSAVDFLHIFLTNMEYFIQKYEIEASYSLSIHDMIQDWLVLFICRKICDTMGPPQLHTPSTQHISSTLKGHSFSAPKIPQFNTENPSVQHQKNCVELRGVLN